MDPRAPAWQNCPGFAYLAAHLPHTQNVPLSVSSKTPAGKSGSMGARPGELQSQIFQHLDYLSAIFLAGTNHFFRRVIDPVALTSDEDRISFLKYAQTYMAKRMGSALACLKCFMIRKLRHFSAPKNDPRHRSPMCNKCRGESTDRQRRLYALSLLSRKPDSVRQADERVLIPRAPGLPIRHFLDATNNYVHIIEPPLYVPDGAKITFLRHAEVFLAHDPSSIGACVKMPHAQTRDGTQRRRNTTAQHHGTTPRHNIDSDAASCVDCGPVTQDERDAYRITTDVWDDGA
ncbi:uncharacterized protein IWZ02DRAFT_493169 [Phyllosticta citriasiana]|uniref:uncharacterized protein n=1 Tax=Phyllosticta citriasiana TaxID=595635 RepID=UPI0030FDDB40